MVRPETKYLDKEINIKIYPENKILIIVSKIAKYNKLTNKGLDSGIECLRNVKSQA